MENTTVVPQKLQNKTNTRHSHVSCIIIDNIHNMETVCFTVSERTKKIWLYKKKLLSHEQKEQSATRLTKNGT